MSDRPANEDEEVVVTIPTQAFETALTPLMNQAPTHMSEDFRPETVGRIDALPCTLRRAWAPRAHVVVSIVQENGGSF